MKRLIIAALVSLAVACGRSSTPPRADVIVAIASAPANLDPGVGIDESSQKIGQLLYSSLLRVDEHLRVVPDLAVTFETRNGQTYAATIPAGVHFHDGREMTSADVAYTFRRFLDPAFVSGRKGAYRELVSIDEIDRYSVAFHLRRPSASFPVNLVMGIVPAPGPGPGAPSGPPVGSGPYALAEFAPDDHVTLTAFRDYYRGAPRNSGVTFKVVPDETMRGLELRKGDVDLVVNDLSPDMVHSLSGERHLAVVTSPGTDYAYIGFNLRDPILRDTRVRLALGYAIDSSAIIRYLRRDLARETPGLVPAMSWAFADDAFVFHRDLDKARALLDAAGFPDPDGAGPAPRLRLTLKTSTQEAYRLQATVIQQQLAEIGVALDVRSYEFATLLSDVVRGAVQLYTLQYVGITDPDMLRRVFLSSQTPPEGFNRGYYANPEVDRLIDAATAALGEEDRRRAYMDAQRLIAADAPCLSLWARTNVAVAQASLDGVTLSPTADFQFLRNVSRR